MTDCTTPKKFGKLCEGYQTSVDDDEPCDQCKNCIKCTEGYYQSGEIPDEIRGSFNI
jgi:hypothetical protein